MNADVARPRTLRLSRGRLRLYSVGLALMGVGQIIWAWKFDFWDWKTFASAGAHVGSAELLHPQNVSISFVYLPGFAWVFAPFAHTSHAVGFAVNAIAMLLCAGAAALIASRAYGVSVPLALALTFAWCPTMNALVIGQNSPAGLLLVMLSLLGARRNAALLTAVPIGLLLYKPTYALPLIGLLVLRSRWREVGIVALIGAAWYAASISAAGGDVTWPRAWLAVVHGWFGPDFAQNGGKAIGLSALLLRAGVPGALILAAAAAIVCSAIPMLRRAPVREAYAVACVLGIALSPHAWGYDAVLALPLIFLALDAVPEPPRTIVVCTAYATAPLMIYADAIGLSPLALPVVGGLAAWFIARGRSMRAARAAT